MSTSIDIYRGTVTVTASADLDDNTLEAIGDESDTYLETVATTLTRRLQGRYGPSVRATAEESS